MGPAGILIFGEFFLTSAAIADIKFGKTRLFLPLQFTIFRVWLYSYFPAPSLAVRALNEFTSTSLASCRDLARLPLPPAQ